MINVIKNEFIKAFYSKRLHIMCGIIFAGVLLMAFILMQKDMMNSSINMKNILVSSLNTVFTTIIPILIIITSCTIISDDYGSGNMKFALITNTKRSDLIIGKLIFTYLMSLILLTIGFVLSFIAGYVILNGKLETNILHSTLLAFKTYIMLLPSFFAFSTFICFISMAISNISTAIGTCIGLYILLISADGWIPKAKFFTVTGGFCISKILNTTNMSGDVFKLICTAFAYIIVFSILNVLIMNKKDVLL